MSEYINVDAAGNEVRTPKGKGRVKLGYTKGEDGNYRVDPTFNEADHKAAVRTAHKVEHFYITLNADGTEASRVAVGRGRPKAGYTKNADGNFVMTVAPAAPAVETAKENEVVAPVADATATA